LVEHSLRKGDIVGSSPILAFSFYGPVNGGRSMQLNQKQLMAITARISLAFYLITWACWIVVDIVFLNASNLRQFGDSLIMMAIFAAPVAIIGLTLISLPVWSSLAFLKWRYESWPGPIQALLFLLNMFVILGCLYFNLKYFGLLITSPKALIAEPAKFKM
jgi:hypothetical protein